MVATVQMPGDRTGHCQACPLEAPDSISRDGLVRFGARLHESVSAVCHGRRDELKL